MPNLIDRLGRLAGAAGEGFQTGSLATLALVPNDAPPAGQWDATSGMTEMVLSHAMERSILRAANTADYVPYAVGGRMRRATCSGVAWFRGYHLAVVNLYGRHLRIYRFHLEDDATRVPTRLEFLHEVNVGINFPEDVAVAPNGTLLAVTHTLSEDFGVSLFSIDARSSIPAPCREIIRPGTTPASAFHGTSFTSDSRHLAFTEISEPGYVEVVSVASPERERTCLITNRLAPLKPKSIAFSHDGQFAAIAMGFNGTPNRRALNSGGMLMIHPFDPRNGVIAPQPLAELTGAGTSLASADMCTFLPSEPGKPYRIIVVDQGADAIPAFEFDAEKQTLVATSLFAAGLSFPHGVDVSADGRYVAITNYGDDSLCIARVMPSTCSGERPTP